DAQSYSKSSKYVQERSLTVASDAASHGERRTVRCAKSLSKADAAMIASADTFFIASQSGINGDGSNYELDVSNRGGPPGFVIVAHETLLLFPDYAGNQLFNTLGNLAVDPRCGLTFVDFDSGDLLQLTGTAETLWDEHHTSRFPGAERVLAVTVDDVRFVERALPIVSHDRGESPTLANFVPVNAAAVLPENHGPMVLLSVNVAGPKDVVDDGKPVSTGIFKQPVDGRIAVRRLNLDGDGQADLWGHGGAFRAVYVYSTEGYDYWSKELDRDLAPGTFGENFTVKGMPDDTICVGDVYRFGSALLEVTQPRIPCYKLAIKIGIPEFQKRFLKGRRVGFYLRVLEEGDVAVGDPIELVRREPNPMTVAQVNELLFFDTTNLDGSRKALAIPALSHGWKGSFEERLQKAATTAKRDSNFRPFRVERKQAESETITSFYLVPEDGEELQPFQPGQFLSFKLAIPGQTKPVVRTYSLSDAPAPDHYRVSIKRESAPIAAPNAPPGLSSTYFHDLVNPGTILEVGPPRGKFTLDLESNRVPVLISAGVGMTPMVAMINALMQRQSNRPVWFIHGARNGREHAMGSYIRELAEREESLHAHVRYSQPDDADVLGRSHDSVGRINVELLKSLLSFDDYEFYLCGPAEFMRSLYCGLLATGVAESRIHYEFFGPGSLLLDDAKPPATTNTNPTEGELTKSAPVTFARSGITVPWDPSVDSILELAEQNGLSPDYSCRSGICQTCICNVIEGEVEYTEEPLDPPPRDQVLICCSRPNGSLIIDI
ncbi:MAG: MOSC domain-containing protein, partial [Pseudomonadota bacterium]